MSVYYDCLTGIQTLIRDANISGIDDSSVVIRKLPWVRGVDVPCVIICPIDDTNKWVNNNEIEIGYGVHIVMVQASNQDLDSYHDTFLYWRDQIIAAIRDDKLSGVSEIINVTIEPSGLFLSQAFRRMYDASALTARCISRETISV